MEGTRKDEGLCEVKPVAYVAYDANEPNLAPESSTEPLLLKPYPENSGTDLVLSGDNVGNFSTDNKSGNANAVLVVGSSLTSQTEMKPVDYDGHEPNLAPESSTVPLLKSIVEPLLLLKHDSENSAGNISVANKSGNENVVLVGNSLTSQTEVKPTLLPESSTEPLLKSIAEPLLLLKHDSENSGKNLVLSCDNAGNFSADNKLGNENAVLVGSALTSSTPVLTELNDVFKGESQLSDEFDIGKTQSKEEKEDSICVLDDKNCDEVAPEVSSKSKKKPCRAAATHVFDTIAGRLRQRRGRSNLEA